jgi:Mce-associated membrane protein
VRTAPEPADVGARDTPATADPADAVATAAVPTDAAGTDRDPADAPTTDVPAVVAPRRRGRGFRTRRAATAAGGEAGATDDLDDLDDLNDTEDTEDTEDTAAGAAPQRARRLRALPRRLPVATTPRSTAAVAAVAAVLLLAAAFMGVSWWRTAHSAAVENTALVDVGATAQVSQQLGDAVRKIYSFDYTRLDQNQQAARAVITPDFQAEYDKLFDQVRTLGTQQQAVVTATISQIAVREIHGDTAVAVVFVDQQATKAAAADGQTQAASAGRLTVTGKLVDGVWKVADVQVR